jgi:anti-anti-sigma regulatory factor
MFGPECNLIVEKASNGVRVARFVRPDLRKFLTPQGEPCALFQELRAAVLDALEEGQTLVLNLGLIEWFPSPFYGCLLKVREAVRARGARLVLCCLGPLVQEVFDLFKGNRLFLVARSEAQVLRDARAGGAGLDRVERADDPFRIGSR